MKITFIKTGKRIKPKNEENRNITKKKTIPKQTGQKQSIQKQTPKKKSNENIFKEIIKKNQIVVVTVALMLITAGYMNYNNKKENDIKLAEIGDAKLVSANVIDDDLNENSSSNINANETDTAHQFQLDMKNFTYKTIPDNLTLRVQSVSLQRAFYENSGYTCSVINN